MKAQQQRLYHSLIIGLYIEMVINLYIGKTLVFIFSQQYILRFSIRIFFSLVVNVKKKGFRFLKT